MRLYEDFTERFFFTQALVPDEVEGEVKAHECLPLTSVSHKGSRERLFSTQALVSDEIGCEIKAHECLPLTSFSCLKSTARLFFTQAFVSDEMGGLIVTNFSSIHVQNSQSKFFMSPALTHIILSLFSLVEHRSLTFC